MRFSEKTSALAASARIANLPSVTSNVFLGVAITWRLGGVPDASRIFLLILAGSLLYLAGNFLNDWADRDWDAVHRPERALPQRLFKPGSYLALALAGLLLGIACAAAVGFPSLTLALLIAAMVLLYTRVHKRAAWSVFPMGLCRALLPVLGGLGLAAPRGLPYPALLVSGIGVFCHIVGLSVTARGESAAQAGNPPIRPAWLWFPAAALAMALGPVLLLSVPATAAFPAALPYLAWTAACLTLLRKPVPRLVSNLLAGIPLVDWIVLLPLGIPLAAFTPFAAVCVALPPLAFLAAKALQTLAPAT